MVPMREKTIVSVISEKPVMARLRAAADLADVAAAPSAEVSVPSRGSNRIALSQHQRRRGGAVFGAQLWEVC